MKSQTAQAYDRFAKTYHPYRKSKENFFNSMIDMPAVLRFLTNIEGKKVLDVGCGSGIYAKILKKRGAKVWGVDISRELVRIAKQEVQDVEFKVASITKLPFKNKSFDVVVGALMMHYLGKWDKALQEVRRVLKPGGIFVFSTGNPVFELRGKTTINGREWKILGYSKDRKKVAGDYYTERWSNWEVQPGLVLRWHHRTYETIINSLLRNGFTIEGYSDAKPIPAGRRISPSEYKVWSKLPMFCVFKVKKVL